MLLPLLVSSLTMTFAKCSDVTVEDDFWSPRFRLWREVTIPDVFRKDETRGHMLENFDRAAKREKGGHQGASFYDGNYLEAVRGASDYLARYPSPKLDAYLDGAIDRIVAAQLPDGYLHTGVQLSDMKYRWGDNGACALGLHEIYNAGCLIEAGVHHYRATGKRKLLACGVRFANFLCETIGPPPRRNLIPTHSLAEEAIVDLVRLIREDKTLAAVEGVETRPDDYLALVKFWFDNHGNNCGVPDWEKVGLLSGMEAISHMGGRHEPNWRPSWGDYQMDRKPLDQYEAIEGHAVRAVLLGAGLAAYADVANDIRAEALAKRFWRSMTGRKLYLTGGVGSNPRPELNLERFGPDYHLPPDAYLETCAAVGNAFFSAELAALTGDGMYMDGFERVIYNALLTGVAHDGCHYTYQNPLNTEKGVRWEWHGVPCCPPMFLKLTGALSGYAYARGSGGYYVNLYLGSAITFAGGPGKIVKISQKSDYHASGRTVITVSPEKESTFPLRLRIPGWSRGEENPFGLYVADRKTTWRISVNGKPLSEPVLDKGYAVVTRRWRSGDAVALQFDAAPRTIRAHEKVGDLKGLVAEMRGPTVYAEENGKLIPYRDVANAGSAPHKVWR